MSENKLTLVELFKKRKQDAKHLDVEENKELEETEYRRLYAELREMIEGSQREPFSEAKYNTIPKFFFKLPSDDEVLKQKLREEARAVFLQRRSRLLLDNEELQALWFLLDKNNTPPVVGEEKMINYTAFKQVAKEAGEKCRPFFTATTFAKLLQPDPYGRIGIMQFFNYVMRKTWLHQTRIGLALYDVAGQGFLRESDLENYILELIPTLPQLDGLEKSFYSFYVCTAVRKFFFFLDPLRTGRVKIQDILACSFLDDLLELRDEELSRIQQEHNWFSAPSALRVYGQYLNLDKDHNGMLSKEELARYGTGTLTGVFIERVFQECLTYDGEMDYKTYLDFVLALENRKALQSLQYFLRLLDISNKGFLNAFDLNYFFRVGFVIFGSGGRQKLEVKMRKTPVNWFKLYYRLVGRITSKKGPAAYNASVVCGSIMKAIQQQMRDHNQEPVLFQDVKDEIFDMVMPTDPLKITYQDLVRSGQAETVVNILIDLNGFWSYENREVLVADQSDGDADVQAQHVSV